MEFTIQADFKHYWHLGTGRGSGHHLDALVETDAQGLPFVAGKTLKGLLRDHCSQAEGWGWFDDHGLNLGRYTLTELVFGQRGTRDPSQDAQRFMIEPGLIQISSLTLDEPHQAWFQTQEGMALKPFLYRDVFSTKIEHDSAQALDKSLRGQQVVVPMQLVGQISLTRPIVGQAADFVDLQCQLFANPTLIKKLLHVALKLTRSLGANKTRGYGRVELHLKDNLAEVA